jgi:hypothetical protein
MSIDIPSDMQTNMEDGERIVGYMKNLYEETIFLTKLGCVSRKGCINIIYRSENDYEREIVSELSSSDVEKYEKMFISAFLWN